MTVFFAAFLRISGENAHLFPFSVDCKIKTDQCVLEYALSRPVVFSLKIKGQLTLKNTLKLNIS